MTQAAEATSRSPSSWGKGKKDLRFLKAILTEHACEADGGENSIWRGYVWAPAAKLVKSKASIDLMLKRARAAAPFGSADDKQEYIEATPLVHGQQHVALCGVSASSGPPRNCVTVAIVTRKDIWLRTLDPHITIFCHHAHFTRDSGSIEIEYLIQTATASLGFAKALNNYLIEKQHLQPELTSDTDGSVSVTSSAPLRNSMTLSPQWRESFDFDAMFDRDADNNILINASLHVMVSQQNSGNLTEYHGLDDAQRSLYAATFDKLVGDSIKSACAGASQLDAKTIKCSQ